MDMPDDAYPRPRRRGDPPPAPTELAPTPAPPPADHGRDARVRHAADLLLRGMPERLIVQAVAETFDVSAHQARRDLADVRAYAQRHLGDEDAIALFVMRKLGALEQVSEKVMDDAMEDPPEEVFDSESGCVTATSADARIKHRQQRAASARAYADITKVQFGVVGARSRFYSPRAKEDQEERRTSPEQEEALAAFWKE